MTSAGRKSYDYTSDLENQIERLGQQVERLKLSLANAKLLIARQAERLNRAQATGRRTTTEIIAAIRPDIPMQRRTLGRLVLDLPMRLVSLDGESFTLTHHETTTMAYLAATPDTLRSAREIAAAIGGPLDGSAVRVYLSRLQPKLKAIGAERYLVSRGPSQGGGYCLTCRHEAKS